MYEKLEDIVNKFKDLSKKIVDPKVMLDKKEFKKLVEEHRTLRPIAEKYEELKKCEKDLECAKELLGSEKDKSMLSFIEGEIKEYKEKKEKLEQDLKMLLLPKDENDDSDVIMEIRAGAGGEEAGLFASDLLRMYMMYAEKQHFKVNILSSSPGELGGVKEVVFEVSGKGAYSKLKFESGVHRVQRVPETESQGRVHTSTVTVAVLPKPEKIKFEILPGDLRIDTYRSSGAGGQHINKTDSAIRITHLPTGIVVTCQDERSQIKNREKAMMILRSKLYDFYQRQKDSEYSANRKAQVGTGSRNEHIRTYNFPQGRITDHRIKYTEYNLLDFMNGNIDKLISALQIDDQRKKFENLDL